MYVTAGTTIMNPPHQTVQQREIVNPTNVFESGDQIARWINKPPMSKALGKASGNWYENIFGNIVENDAQTARYLIHALNINILML